MLPNAAIERCSSEIALQKSSGNFLEENLQMINSSDKLFK